MAPNYHPTRTHGPIRKSYPRVGIRWPIACVVVVVGQNGGELLHELQERWFERSGVGTELGKQPQNHHKPSSQQLQLRSYFAVQLGFPSQTKLNRSLMGARSLMSLWPFIFQEDVHWRLKLANHSRFDFSSFLAMYTFTLTPWIAQNLCLYLIKIFLVLSCGACYCIS